MNLLFFLLHLHTSPPPHRIRLFAALPVPFASSSFLLYRHQVRGASLSRSPLAIASAPLLFFLLFTPSKTVNPRAHTPRRSAPWQLSARFVLLAASCALSLCLTPRELQAQGNTVDHGAALSKLSDAQRASFGELLGRAQVSFEQGDFERALELLSEAQAIYPHPRILYKMAEAYERSGKLQQARDHYQLYLESGDQGEDRAVIQGLITNLDRRLNAPATLILNTVPQGALVYIGEETQPIGATPLRYPLPPGTYSLRLELDGHQQETVSVTAKPGVDIVLDRSLKAGDPNGSEQPGAGNTTTPIDPPPSSIARPIGIVSAVLGVGSGALFLLARRDASTLDASYDARRTGPRPEDLESTTSRHNALVLGAWSLAALSAAGATWSVLRWSKERAYSSDVSVQASPSGAALSLEVNF